MALSPTEESLVRQLIAQNPALLNLASSESTIISKLGATKVSLSDLSAATSLSDADLALVRQGLNDKSFAMSVLLDYVGNNLTLPAASETVAGVVEIATTAEAQALTDDTTALTPKKLGEALDANVFGAGQTWQDVTASRASGVNYTNSTGKPIMVSLSAGVGSVPNIEIHVDGVITFMNRNAFSSATEVGCVGIIPAGSTYKAVIDGTLTFWKEFR